MSSLLYDGHLLGLVFIAAAWVLAASLVLVLGPRTMKVAPLLPKAGLRFTRSGLPHSNRLLAKRKPSYCGPIGPNILVALSILVALAVLTAIDSRSLGPYDW
ncbi:hypothetical protein [Corynebacterium sp. 5QC2CO]|uniref:hypothetical protein n=1 Tax=Corynebacterium sp. 5QC2CO TaxID=2968468 RepID=UPI00211CE65C|nr:hypothetical protein [Corynebacterium sp. 5QC2CO]MCQ9350938.1 hypothetical protein [Corynebacterium sp. 5QC2CO]